MVHVHDSNRTTGDITGGRPARRPAGRHSFLACHQPSRDNRAEMAEHDRDLHPSHIFAWVTGGLSLLHLIRDLSPVELFGLVKEWGDAYALLVRHTATLLFAWVNWRWMQVSENETHVLVLAVLLGAAFARATRKALRDSGYPFRPLEAPAISTLTALFLCVAPQLLLAALLPDPYGVWVGGPLFAGTLFSLTTLRGEGIVNVAWPDIRRELSGVGGFAVIMLLLNYAVFRPT
jgi:hypothetical protein